MLRTDPHILFNYVKANSTEEVITFIETYADNTDALNFIDAATGDSILLAAIKAQIQTVIESDRDNQKKQITILSHLLSSSIIAQSINHGDLFGYTALVLAACYDLTESLSWLLMQKPDLNKTDNATKSNLLMWAVECKNVKAVKVICDHLVNTKTSKEIENYFSHQNNENKSVYDYTKETTSKNLLSNEPQDPRIVQENNLAIEHILDETIYLAKTKEQRHIIDMMNATASSSRFFAGSVKDTREMTVEFVLGRPFIR